MNDVATTWFQQNPTWVWFSLLPGLGSLGLCYAGIKIRNPLWTGVGAGITLLSVALLSSAWVVPLWILQIFVAFRLRRPFLLKTYPLTYPLPLDPSLIPLIAATRPPVDINTCSKDDMIKQLGLPLAYANDIEVLQRNGYQITSIEDLIDVAGIPESVAHQIEPLLVFQYDFNREAKASWRRFNTYTQDELVAVGFDETIAQRILEERTTRGDFRSVVDLKKRVGIDINRHQLQRKFITD